MFIRPISDLHLEFSSGFCDIPVLPDEDREVLVLAGDIGIANKPYTYMPFLHEMSERFQDIIYIGGNHEFYHGSVVNGLDKIKENIKQSDLHNIHAVENEVVRIFNVSFVCSTLWSSFDNGNPVSMFDAQQGMNDFRIIRTGPPGVPYQKKFRPSDAYALYLKAKDFIFPAIKKEREDGQKVVVVTHMGPSLQSIPDEFKTSRLNGAYVSDLDNEIFDADPDLIIHGHTHTSFAYEIGQTAVLVNPRGYHGVEENPNFNPALRVEI